MTLPLPRHLLRTGHPFTMAMRRRLKNKKPPEGWELIEEVIEDFELQAGNWWTFSCSAGLFPSDGSVTAAAQPLSGSAKRPSLRACILCRKPACTDPDVVHGR